MTKASELERRLKEELGVRGVLVQMARGGQLAKLHCEMPTCHHPKDRKTFDHRTRKRDLWTVTADHYPQLKSQGGHLVPENVRLAHKYCNNNDHGWRSKIVAMLRKKMTLEQIADSLNRQSVTPPRPGSKWTASSVRSAFTS